MNKKRLFVLNFHGLGRPAITVPSAEENYWLDADVFARLLDMAAEREDVLITFDDANESDHTIALPLLKERRMTARFFVVAGRIDQKGYLSRKQVDSLCAEGMSVESHGMRHRPWHDCGEEELDQEIVRAKRMIEDFTGRPVSEAACPFGSYGRKVLAKLRRSGYEKVWTSDGGWASADGWMAPRNTIVRSTNVDAVRGLMAASPTASKRLLRRVKLVLKRWR